MNPALRASIIVVGDEILGGFVQDTNSGWFAQRCQALGVPLDRIQTVPDDIPAIGEALDAELSRAQPRVVLTSGGVGSTPDDVTLEAIGHSLGRALETEPRIEALIGAGLERARAAGLDLSDEHARSLHKMALVPAGSYLLPGAEGFNPGVALDVDGGSRVGGATIVILPGIPGEFRRIVSEGVEPALMEGRGAPQHVMELRHPYPESFLNPVLDRLVADFPDLHVGSYPGRECTIRLKGEPARVGAAALLVEKFLAELHADERAQQMSADWQQRWSRAVDDA